MVGSLLLVSPANLLTKIAKKSGAKAIFINRDRTIMDDLADIFLKGSCGEILTELMKLVK